MILRVQDMSKKHVEAGVADRYLCGLVDGNNIVVQSLALFRLMK